MIFRQLFDRESSTYTYLLADEVTREAVFIDPVYEQVDRDVELLTDLRLRLVYSLETHVHADHITASGVLRKRLGCKTVVSAAAGAGCPDVLVEQGQKLRVGHFEIEARQTPGHTNGDVTYVVSGGPTLMAFTGDTLLIRGCGRTDFQQGNSDSLYRSVHDKIFTLPNETFVYPGHDYKGRTVSTVGEEKQFNPRLGEGTTIDSFRETMANLDLAQPKKIGVAVAANLQCGLIQEAAAVGGAPNAIWAPVVRSEKGIPEVTAGWLRDHTSDVRVIDVREVHELVGALGALPDVEHIPMGTLEAEMAEWTDADPEGRIVVVCRSGGRSGQAAIMLEQAGFTRVASLQGGMLAYRALASSEDNGTCAGV